MQSRATISGGFRKSDLQQSRRASAVAIPPVSLLSISQQQQPPQPPPPPPPPPRRNTNNTTTTATTAATNNSNTSNESKHRERRLTTMVPQTKSISPLYSLYYIIQKQHQIWSMLQQSRYFHLWRRETIYFRESMKTRNERTTALMLGGVDEDSLDYLEPTRKKTTKLGISLMRWILVSMTSKNLTRAWRTWKEYVSNFKHYETKHHTGQSLVTLQKENEELKLKFNELKNKIQSREIILRDGIAKNQISSLIRMRIRNVIRKRFDRWYRITWEGKYENELRRQKLKVDVGFQHIRSEREMVKEIEVLSGRLKVQLLCMISFYRWKITTMKELISIERARWIEEKRAIFKELLLIKRGVISINKKEEQLVTAAKSRGIDIFTSLQNIGEKIEKISNFKLEIPDKSNF